MRHFFTVFGVLIVVAAGVSGGAKPSILSTGAAPDGAESHGVSTETVRDALECAIRGEPTCEAGTAPKIRVTLTNRSGRAICLVGSLDASDCKWRYPHCYFEVVAPGGRAPGGIGRCGNMNRLRANDFVRVAPGGTFDPYQVVDGHGFFSAHQLAAGNFSEPGVYRIRFVYSTRSEDVAAWGGDGGAGVTSDAEVMRMFRLVPKVEVRSEEFLVRVVGKGE